MWVQSKGRLLVMGYKYIKLSQGYRTKVDVEDYALLSRFSWHYVKAPRDKQGYAVCSTPPYRNNKMHRVILSAKKGEIVDHKNQNSLDNRRSNIRIVDAYTSAVNRTLSNKYGTGVSKVGNKFTSRITYKGKRIYLGYFNTQIAAEEIYKEAKGKLYGI